MKDLNSKIYKLERKSDNCFSEPENESSQYRNRFFRYLLDFETVYEKLKKTTQNKSDIELSRYSYPLNYSRLIESGNEIDVNIGKNYATKDRIETIFTGRSELNRRCLGLISESGISDSFDFINFDIKCSNQIGESGLIWFNDHNSFETGFYLTAQISNERFYWLDKEISSRPSSKVKISVFLRAFQEAADYNLASYDHRQFYYLEDKPTNILGISISITD